MFDVREARRRELESHEARGPLRTARLDLATLELARAERDLKALAEGCEVMFRRYDGSLNALA